MRKLLLFSAAFFAVFNLKASQRLELYEGFTNASCPPCAAINPSLNALLKANRSKVAYIKYQVNFPGTDPMNAHNPTQVSTRQSYYGVNSVPSGRLDGGIGFNGNPISLSQTNINSRSTVSSPFEINVNFRLSPNQDSIYTHADVNCTAPVNASNIVVHTVVIEQVINFVTAPGSNGEKEFDGVMVQMLPSATGLPVASSWAAGDSIEVDQAWKLPTWIYNKNQLAVVVFIQNNSTKEVYQAGYLRPQMAREVEVANLAGIPSISCINDFTPSFDIINNAVDTLTSLDIQVSIDGVAQTFNWTGSLAPGASTNYVLPTQTSAAGSHTFSVVLNNPNGGADLFTNNNSVSTRYAIYSTPFTLPLAEAFAAAAFPPPNFAVENVDGDAYTWARSAAGLNGAGSAKYNAYSAAAGTYDYLYLPKFDFSTAVAGASLRWDVAYAQYDATSAERLQVEISTDCGANWTNVYDKTGATLATAPIVGTGAFTPNATQWRREVVYLDQFVGQSEILVRFTGISDYGNNMYLDNINVSTASTTSIDNINAESISVYPNPATDKLNIELVNSNSEVFVTLINTLGAVVKSTTITRGSSVTVMDISGIATGNYVLKLQDLNGVTTRKVNIQ